MAHSIGNFWYKAPDSYDLADPYEIVVATDELIKNSLSNCTPNDLAKIIEVLEKYYDASPKSNHKSGHTKDDIKDLWQSIAHDYYIKAQDSMSSFDPFAISKCLKGLASPLIDLSPENSDLHKDTISFLLIQSEITMDKFNGSHISMSAWSIKRMCPTLVKLDEAPSDTFMKAIFDRAGTLAWTQNFGFSDYTFANLLNMSSSFCKDPSGLPPAEFVVPAVIWCEQNIAVFTPQNTVVSHQVIEALEKIGDSGLRGLLPTLLKKMAEDLDKAIHAKDKKIVEMLYRKASLQLCPILTA